jgi:ribosome maturation factor RimP
MNTDQQIQALELMMNRLLEQDPGCFLVEIRIKPTNNIRVFLDADKGLTIDRCVEFNRALCKQIEESNLYPGGDFSLEVSSPGLEVPLKLRRQYVKNVGRKVEVLTGEGTKLEGKLVDVNDREIVLELTSGKGKKQVTQTNHIPFEQIKYTRIAVVF